jgi:glycyl-tRNA synthetase (class II)
MSCVQRSVMSFKPVVAPIKAGIYPLLSGKDELSPYVNRIVTSLTAAGTGRASAAPSGNYRWAGLW